MQILRRLLSVCLCFPLLLNAQGNTFTKVRYNGGSIPTKVKPDEWHNNLSVTSDAITLTMKDGQSIIIPVTQVSSLSFGEEAHRRVGRAIGLAFISFGIGAISLVSKHKEYFIGVNFEDAEGKKQGILLEGEKDNYRGIILALHSVTGKPVAVGEKERGELPAGVSTEITNEPADTKVQSTASVAAPTPASPSSPQATVAPSSTSSATVSLSTNPNGAEVYSDGEFAGNAPASLKLPAGKHTIRVSQAGYRDWAREITINSGSEVHLTATLEKQN